MRQPARRKSPLLEELPEERVCGWNIHQECEASRPQADRGSVSRFIRPPLQACVSWCACKQSIGSQNRDKDRLRAGAHLGRKPDMGPGRLPKRTGWYGLVQQLPEHRPGSRGVGVSQTSPRRLKNGSAIIRKWKTEGEC